MNRNFDSRHPVIKSIELDILNGKHSVLDLPLSQLKIAYQLDLHFDLSTRKEKNKFAAAWRNYKQRTIIPKMAAKNDDTNNTSIFGNNQNAGNVVGANGTAASTSFLFGSPLPGSSNGRVLFANGTPGPATTPGFRRAVGNGGELTLPDDVRPGGRHAP